MSHTRIPAVTSTPVLLALAVALLVAIPALSQPGPRASVAMEQTLRTCTPATDLDSALTEADEWIELHPDNPSLYRHRAALYYLKGETDLALMDLTTLMEWDPLDPELLLDQGFIYVQARFNELAVEVLTEAIEMDPTLGRAYLNRALAYQDEGKTMECMVDLSAAIVMDPLLADAYFLRGTLYGFAFDEWEKAEADFLRCMETTDNEDLLRLAEDALEYVP
jgi:tetratricopeptide (TPR) repeat protein